MKRTSLPLLTLMAILSLACMSSAQSLKIRTQFTDPQSKPVQSEYTLYSNDSILKTGNDTAVDMNLMFDTHYTLVVSRKGYTTKSIGFSTSTHSTLDYQFEFSIILQPTMHPCPGLALAGSRAQEIAMAASGGEFTTEEEEFWIDVAQD